MRSALLPRRLCPDDELTGSYSESEGPLGHSALISLVCSRRVASRRVLGNLKSVDGYGFYQIWPCSVLRRPKFSL